MSIPSPIYINWARIGQTIANYNFNYICLHTALMFPVFCMLVYHGCILLYVKEQLIRGSLFSSSHVFCFAKLRDVTPNPMSPLICHPKFISCFSPWRDIFHSWFFCRLCPKGNSLYFTIFVKNWALYDSMITFSLLGFFAVVHFPLQNVQTLLILIYFSQFFSFFKNRVHFTSSIC